MVRTFPGMENPGERRDWGSDLMGPGIYMTRFGASGISKRGSPVGSWVCESELSRGIRSNERDWKPSL